MEKNEMSFTEEQLKEFELGEGGIAEPKLVVEGTVFIGSIQRRGKTSKNKIKNSNVVKTVGYKIRHVDTGEWFFMEKFEAIYLALKLGVVNATIRPRRNNTKDKYGNVIATNFHLNLHPIKGERPFTDADRLYPVFKLDRNGKITRPPELEIKEENCTELMWKLVQDVYKKRKSKGTSKAYQKISAEETKNRIDAALLAANFQGVDDPFDN